MRNLSGGKIVGVSPDRVRFPMYGDHPGARLTWPGSILGNMAMGVQLYKTAEKRIGSPDPTWVKVIVKELGGEVLFIITPVHPPKDPQMPEPDTYPLKVRKGTKAPVIRGLKWLLEEARIQLRPDTWYEVEAEEATDEVGQIVALSWTKAVAHAVVPKAEGGTDEAEEEEEEVAAGDNKS